MSKSTLLFVIMIVALASYLLRVLPLALLRKPITQPHVVAFIEYLPYAILTAMVLPDIFSATGDTLSSSVGFVVALVLALLNQSLPVVAALAAVAAWVTQLFL